MNDVISLYKKQVFMPIEKKVYKFRKKVYGKGLIKRLFIKKNKKKLEKYEDLLLEKYKEFEEILDI